MTTIALIVTVGGSYKPVVSAITDVKPDYTVFICSHDVEVTNTKGSYTQIEGGGKIIKAEPSDKNATLPNIPTQTGLQENQFEVIKVYPDEVDDVYRAASDAIERLKELSYSRIVCNYTGGTKSMTAALVIAGLDMPDVEVEFVSGARTDLNQVTSDDSVSMQANVEHVRFRKKYEAAIARWRDYDYHASASQMHQLIGSRGREHQVLARQVYIAAQAFSAWDIFDHAEAQQHLDKIKGSVGQYVGSYRSTLSALRDKKINKRQAAQILDLWLNAQRCATRKRYDDAMARCYRLIECSAQWLLQYYAEIETARIPADKVPTHMTLPPSNKEKGHYQAGLMDAWALVAELCPQSCAEFWQKNASRLRDIIQSRNHSILAHGFAPVSHVQWHEMADWIEHELIPVMLDHMKNVGIKQLPQQLPNDWFIKRN